MRKFRIPLLLAAALIMIWLGCAYNVKYTLASIVPREYVMMEYGIREPFKAGIFTSANFGTHVCSRINEALASVDVTKCLFDRSALGFHHDQTIMLVYHVPEAEGARLHVIEITTDGFAVTYEMSGGNGVKTVHEVCSKSRDALFAAVKKALPDVVQHI